MISLIVAVSKNGVIGKNGKLPWHLPSELANFKHLTMGHPVIMGRKTFESIGKPLPGRRNIIVTRDKGYQAENCIVAHSLEEALATAQAADEIFIIGGQSLFEEALSKADKIYLTKVDAQVDGDTFFNLDLGGWQETSSQHHPADARNQYAYDFTVLERSGL